jgi:diguanylate cyclase (GGDEF)-like protein
VVFPAWNGFDVLLEPALASRFLAVRLAGLVPIAVAAWLLWRRPAGRRLAEPLSMAILVVVQAAVVWMIPQVRTVEPYVLGLSVALLVSGCVLAAHPRWTAGLVAGTWAALLGAVLLAPTPMPVRALAIAGFYLATASLVAVIVHVHRYRLSVRELEVRLRLEQEQRRTGVLLAKLQRLSQEDPLTGLANRRRWDAELATACADARRNGTAVAVVLLDLDHFKQINDRHGHAAGDAFLVEVAERLRRSVRASDLVARLGGDEFFVVLEEVQDTPAVESVVGKLIDALRRPYPGIGEAQRRISATLGVSIFPDDATDAATLMENADEAMYTAKQAGKNAYCLYSSTRKPAPPGNANSGTPPDAMSMA